MPIKFRCIHCGQYLGISRSKAGTVVDCPTCGRSMGVPLKDGQAERVGRPSLNHEDSQLAEALREVAAIAHSSDSVLPQLPPALDRGGDARETREVHVPPPKAIPAKPLPPAERLEPPAPPKGHIQVPTDFEEEDTLFTQVPLSELATLAEMDMLPEPTPLAPPKEHSPFPRTNAVPWKLWLAFIAVGFVALFGGFLLGRWDRDIQPSNESTPTPADENPSSVAPSTLPDVIGRLGQVAARGKVEFSHGQGTAILPDAGAWIYAFPLQNKAGVKIPAGMFQSEPSQIASALRALGGNAVQSDEEGHFQLPLLFAGKYLVLICSENKTGPSTRTVPEALNQYFDNPQTFLAHRAFQERELDYQGEALVLSLDAF